MTRSPRTFRITPAACSTRGRAWTLVRTAVLLGIVTGGCGRSGDTGSAGALESRAERDNGVIVVSVPGDRFTTVDQIPVTISTTAPAGHAARAVVFDPEFAGWTVIDRPPARVRTDTRGRAVRTERYLLEPFLDGAYEIPSATVAFAEPGQPPAFELSTTPFEVSVVSVLAEDASIDDLAPPTGPVEPPALADNRGMPAWAIALAAVLLGVGVVVVVRAVTSAGRTEEPDLAAEIGRLRNEPPTDARDRLASLLRRARATHSHPSLDAMIERLDRERYAPPGREARNPVEPEIDEALRLLTSGGGVS